MRIGLDIGGVISKYPDIFKKLISKFCVHEIYIITDQHPKEHIIKVLEDNKFTRSEYVDVKNVETQIVTETNKKIYTGIQPENIYCADYEKYGNMAKAILIKELNLDIFIDDFDGYLQWDSSLGPQPLLLKVQCDAFKPYWSELWKQDGGDFGRRKYVKTN